MPSLLHNPVADLPGPEFLVFFWAVAGAVITAVFLSVRRLDPSLGLGPPPSGFKLDPRALACLRGGAGALLQTTLFDLWRRGFLGIVEPKEGTRHMVRAEEGRDPSVLDEYEREILNEFETPRSLGGLRNEAKLLALAERRASALELPLQDELFLMPGEARARAHTVAWLTGTFLVLLAGYKFDLAVEKGHHNVAFLIVSMVIALCGVAGAARLPRQTRRGSDYLDRLRLALGGWSDWLREEPGHAMSPNALLAVALFGYAALAGTPQETAWLSIGTALDASGDCGGGCGGGCGGCGGCGG